MPYVRGQCVGASFRTLMYPRQRNLFNVEDTEMIEIVRCGDTVVLEFVELNLFDYTEAVELDNS